MSIDRSTYRGWSILVVIVVVLSVLLAFVIPRGWERLAYTDWVDGKSTTWRSGQLVKVTYYVFKPKRFSWLPGKEIKIEISKEDLDAWTEAKHRGDRATQNSILRKYD